MTLTCAIIDDEPLAISLLESYVNKTPFLRLTAKFNSALEALPVLSAQPVELLFLDIQMPELSGMEFSRILEADTRIIYDGFRTVCPRQLQGERPRLSAETDQLSGFPQGGQQGVAMVRAYASACGRDRVDLHQD